MVDSLDSLSRNLVGANGMICKECGSEVELKHIDENFVAHGMCGKCRDASYHKLEINPIFDNLRVGHTTVAHNCHSNSKLLPVQTN